MNLAEINEQLINDEISNRDKIPGAAIVAQGRNDPNPKRPRAEHYDSAIPLFIPPVTELYVMNYPREPSTE